MGHRRTEGRRGDQRPDGVGPHSQPHVIRSHRRRSSEHHTVKPWFNGKISFAPIVVDLKEQGFPLVGARIDVVNLAPAATLVYRAGKHLISLTEMPNAQAPTGPAGEHREQGYLALSWNDGQMAFWAVSDAAPEELERFVEAFRAAGKPTT